MRPLNKYGKEEGHLARMKCLLLLFLISLSAVSNAQVNISCTGAPNAISCLSPSSSLLSSVFRTVTNPTGGSRPTSELVINNANKDLVNLGATSDSRPGLLSILTANGGVKTDYNIRAAGSFLNGNSKNADDVYLLGDSFGNITINIAGYHGFDGKGSSQLCIDKINAGFYGQPTADDSLKQYISSNSKTQCDSNTLDLIATVAPPNFCPSGFVYDQSLDNSSAPQFVVSRRKFMLECAATIQTGCGGPSSSGCIASGAVYAPSFQYMTIGNSCAAGYSVVGLTQNYPCPHAGDDPNCTVNTESLPCSNGSCQGATYKQSFDTNYGATVARQAGQAGSYGGSVNIFTYDVDLYSISYANGANGAAGLDDLNQHSYTKYCTRILDNNTSSLDTNAPERNTPSVNVHQVTFWPLLVQAPSGISNLNFPVRTQADAVGVFKKLDSSIRDYVFRSVIQTAP